MKRILLIMLGLMIIPAALFAQVATDPNDRLYTWISIWEEKGYLTDLPLLRPYPVQLLKECLLAVMQKGTDEERLRAETWLKQLDVTIGDPIPNRSLPAPLTLSVENTFWTQFGALRDDLMLYAVIQGRLGEYFSFSGKGGWGGMIETQNFYGPEWMRITSEAETGSGSADLGDLVFWAQNLGVGTVTVGTPELYFQAGLSRSSFGPFFENGAVIGPQASAAGHFSLTYVADWIKISSVMLVLHPKYYKTESEPSAGEFQYNLESIGAASWANFLFVHSYTFTPLDWLDFGVVQTVILGGTFNPVFALPFAHTFFAQMLYGDDQSSLVGLYGTIRFPLNIQLKLLLYVDDFNVNRFLGLDGGGGLFSLDSAQDKVAFQAGLVWTPEIDVVRRVSLDYLLVTPYFGTHYAGYGNHISYTHMGNGVGSILEPNSDQITLTAFLQPAPWFDIKINGRFARHGNASDFINLMYPSYQGDGSYYDDGYYNNVAQFIGPAQFLNQAVLEYVLQLGFDLSMNFGLGGSELEIGLGYMFEYVRNKNLVSGAEEFNHFLKVYTKYAL